MTTPDVYRAISDPTRRRILDLLAVKERPVRELMEPFDMSQPAVSQHLKVLREAGLVKERKVGRERQYRLTPGPLKEVASWIGHYDRFWRERIAALERYLDEEADKDEP
jgi:DNA-binding transcriptional ArsR family regulator